jgi:hypothetical protein
VHHYVLDSGVRLLPAALYFKFDAALSALKREHQDAVAAFLGEYEEQVGLARYRMGNLFDQADYPTRNEVALKFRFEVVYLPVPDTDFRQLASKVDLDAVTATAVNQERERVGRINADLADRVRRAASDFAAKIQPGKVFRDSITDGMGELAAIIDGLNILGDPQVAAIATQVKVLAKVSPDALRDSNQARSEVLAQADDLRKRCADIAEVF